mmetsp:Transcript_30627/g.40760  ORF Transcript_30627/g.40760 Transcript_30627/m.40760 type:complete len:134 (+) Transcript_30627:253-654(+)
MQRPAIKRLLEASSHDKIDEIIRCELSTDEGEIDFYYIGEQMDEHELTFVGPAFSEYALNKHWRYFGIREDLVDLTKSLSHLEEFNVLHLNSSEFDADDSKIIFAVGQFGRLSATEKLFVNELSRTVTDTNLY